MTFQIDVRPARAEDKEAVLAFCQNTFTWGDYIPGVWEKWLSDLGGQMLVAAVDAQPVGLVHVAFLGDDDAWMEGMRVHPDFRRRGVGTAVDAAAQSVARQRGRRVARLATRVDNVAAQKTLARQGYSRVALFNEWEAEPAHHMLAATRVATLDDQPGLIEAWRASGARAASPLLPDRYWHWQTQTPARLLGQIKAGEVRSADGGFALLLAFDENDWSGLSVHAIVGDEETAYVLAAAARGEAEYRGYPHVEAQLVDHPQLNAALERAGYRHTGGMYIYELILK